MALFVSKSRSAVWPTLQTRRREFNENRRSDWLPEAHSSVYKLCQSLFTSYISRKGFQKACSLSSDPAATAVADTKKGVVVYEVSSIKNANIFINYEGIKLQKFLIACKKGINVEQNKCTPANIWPASSASSSSKTLWGRWGYIRRPLLGGKLEKKFF